MYNLLLYQKYVGIPKINRTPNIPNKRSHSHIPKSDSYGALRYRTSTPQQVIPPERFAIALPHPKSDRIPTSQKRSHPHIPKTAIAPLNPKRDRIPTSPKAIALPHPQIAIAPSPHSQNSDRTPNIPKVSIKLNL